MSIITPKSSSDGDLEFISCFCDRSGVQESTTLTAVKEHKRDFGGISIKRADKLHTLTGNLTVILEDSKDITRGQTVKSPDKEVFICSVTAALS